MKKLLFVFAAAMLTASASAQKTAITSNKAGDNWYIGANIGITVGAAVAENALDGYFTNNIVPSALEFNVHKVTVAGVEKSFVGMSGNYIGYSPYTSNGLTINYNGLSGVTRQDATHSEINVFQ